MIKSIGNPDVMLLDVRPFNRPLLIIRDAEIAEQVSKQSKTWPYGIPKNKRMNFLGPLIGPQSIILTTVGLHFPMLLQLHGLNWPPKTDMHRLSSRTGPSMERDQEAFQSRLCTSSSYVLVTHHLGQVGALLGSSPSVRRNRRNFSSRALVYRYHFRYHRYVIDLV